jgi:hypothetical protein
LTPGRGAKSVQNLKAEKIAGTNGISAVLLLGKRDNSFTPTPSFGSSNAILKEIFAYNFLLY